MNIVNLISFSIGGAVSGLIIAWSMDLKTPKELLQGAVGGVIVGVTMTLLLPA
jgi:hypothetical protein